MQRTVRSQVFPPDTPQSLAFHPLPESQPVLPCLLRRLLQKDRFDDALELARWAGCGELQRSPPLSRPRILRLRSAHSPQPPTPPLSLRFSLPFHLQVAL